VHSLDVPLAGPASTTRRPRLAMRALVATLLLLAGGLPGAGADDCTAKCTALMTEFRTTIPADRVTAVEQSPVWLRSSLQMFCKRKSLYAGGAARAEFGFFQHAANRALTLLEREGGQSLSGLAAACSNSTWMGWGNYSEQCAVTATGGQQETGAHVCFTDRSDEQRIDGEWRPATHPPAYRVCTDILSNEHKSLCSTRAKGEPVNLGHQEFHATSCVLLPMDEQDFARVIGHGATLWFIGDSVTAQMSSSLVCALRAGGFTVTSEKIRGVKCFILTHPRFNHSARVCSYITYTSSNLFKVLMRLNADAHKTEYQETLVLNFGLHVDKTDYHGIHTALGQWQAYRPPTGRKLQLVWRDTSPQHFSEKGGLYNHTNNSTTPCAPIDDMRAAWEPYQNMTAMLSEFPEIHRLPTWSLSAPRWNAHHAHECTHWCLPGVPDVWVRLLYALLKAQSSLNEHPELDVGSLARA